MKKKVTLLTIFVLLFSSLTMLKAQPPAALTKNQQPVLLPVAQASKAIEEEKKPLLGRLFTEVAHKDVRPLIIKYVATAPKFIDAAKEIVPLALTSKALMKESIKALENRITREAEDKNVDIKRYATDLLFKVIISSSSKPVPLIAIKALIGAGADVNVRNPLRITPLLLAAEMGSKKIVESLIEAGADVNVRNERDITPLLRAAENGHIETVDALINANADVNAQAWDGDTPLLRAAQNGHKEIVQKLLDAGAGASVNAQGKYNYTPLIRAAEEGHKEIVQKLLDAGADKTIKDLLNRTAHEIATDPEIKRLLE